MLLISVIVIVNILTFYNIKVKQKAKFVYYLLSIITTFQIQILSNNDFNTYQLGDKCNLPNEPLPLK